MVAVTLGSRTLRVVLSSRAILSSEGNAAALRPRLPHATGTGRRLVAEPGIAVEFPVVATS